MKLLMIVLTVLALGVWADALIPLIRPTVARAGSLMTCSGEVSVKNSVWGVSETKSTIDGYKFQVQCH